MVMTFSCILSRFTHSTSAPLLYRPLLYPPHSAEPCRRQLQPRHHATRWVICKHAQHKFTTLHTKHLKRLPGARCSQIGARLYGNVCKRFQVLVWIHRLHSIYYTFMHLMNLVYQLLLCFDYCCQHKLSVCICLNILYIHHLITPPYCMIVIVIVGLMPLTGGLPPLPNLPNLNLPLPDLSGVSLPGGLPVGATGNPLHTCTSVDVFCICTVQAALQNLQGYCYYRLVKTRFQHRVVLY